MYCQKKSEQMRERINDFVLDELSPKGEAELLAHVAGCEACRAAYDHAKAVRSLVDRGVETLVAGEPSPQFMARLRARIDAEPAPMRWSWDAWRIWEQASRWPLSFAAGAVVLATILAVLVMGLPRRHVSSPEVTGFTPATSATASLGRDPSKNSPNLHRSWKEFPSRSVPSPKIRREPEVLVPRGELLAVAQFYEAVHSGRVDGDQLYAGQLAIQNPLEVKPIEIAPLEPLHQPVADPDNGPSLF